MVGGDSQGGTVSFCSRLKALVDNPLRLNTEEGRLVYVETELEAFGRLQE